MLEEVIHELNKTIGDLINVRLELIKWENNTSPSIKGIDAQDIINKQIDDKYDIFIGIMWSRSGTKTSRADSGTIEEFQRAYSRVKSGENVEIMFYFNELPISPKDIDVDQFKTIQEFRTKIKNDGAYYWSYEGVENFVSLVRVHLTMKLKNWNHTHLDSSQEKEIEISTIDEDEDEDEDEGILDLYTSLNQSAFYLNISLNNIKTLVTDFGTEIEQRTDEISAISDKKNIRFVKIGITRIAIIMDNFASKLEPEVEDLNGGLNRFLDTFSKFFSIVKDFDGSFSEDEDFLSMVEEMQSVLKDSGKSIEDIKNLLLTIPPIQKDLTKSKKRIMNQFSNINILMSTAVDTINSMRKIIEQ